MAARAHKWVSCVREDGPRFGLFTASEAVSRQIEERIADDPAISVSILGAARQGKSSGMNYFTGPAVPDPTRWNEGLFTVSGSGLPCTKGLDVILEPEPLAAFVERAHAGLPGSAPIPVAPSVARGRVLWCDYEGKGDEGVDHDTRVAVPAVTLSSVLLYNHPNTALKSDILSALGLIAGAAEQAGMDAAAAADGGAEAASAPRFGHLHVIVRDYGLDADLGDARYEAAHAQATWAALMADEPVRRVGTDAERDRNSIRALLRRCFRSMTLWLLPQPFAMGDHLRAVFLARMAELRYAIALQAAAAPAYFGGEGDAHALTGHRIARLLPAVVEAANVGAFIPQNLHAVMMQRMVQEAVDRATGAAATSLDGLLEAVRQTPLPLRKLQLAVVGAVEPAVESLTAACSPPRLHVSPEDVAAAHARLLASIRDKLALLRSDNCAKMASALMDLRGEVIARYYAAVAPALEPILAGLAAKRPPTDADKRAAKEAAMTVCEHTRAETVVVVGRSPPYRDFGLGFGDPDAGLVPDPFDPAVSPLSPAAQQLLHALWPPDDSDDDYSSRADWDRGLAEDPSRLMEKGRLDSELNCAFFSGVAAHTQAQMNAAMEQVNHLNGRVAAGERLSQDLQAKLREQEAAALRFKGEMERAQREAGEAKRAAEAAQAAARAAAAAGGGGKKKRSKCEIM